MMKAVFIPNYFDGTPKSIGELNANLADGYDVIQMVSVERGTILITGKYSRLDKLKKLNEEASK